MRKVNPALQAATTTGDKALLVVDLILRLQAQFSLSEAEAERQLLVRIERAERLLAEL